MPSRGPLFRSDMVQIVQALRSVQRFQSFDDKITLVAKTNGLLKFNSLGFQNLVQRFDAEPEARHAAGNCRDLDGFENFSRTCAQRQGALAVKFDAARAVKRARDADHDQFFGLARQGTFAAERGVDINAFELFEILWI